MDSIDNIFNKRDEGIYTYTEFSKSPTREDTVRKELKVMYTRFDTGTLYNLYSPQEYYIENSYSNLLTSVLKSNENFYYNKTVYNHEKKEIFRSKIRNTEAYSPYTHIFTHHNFLRKIKEKYSDSVSFFVCDTGVYLSFFYKDDGNDLKNIHNEFFFHQHKLDLSYHIFNCDYIGMHQYTKRVAFSYLKHFPIDTFNYIDTSYSKRFNDFNPPDFQKLINCIKKSNVSIKETDQFILFDFFYRACAPCYQSLKEFNLVKNQWKNTKIIHIDLVDSGYSEIKTFFDINGFSTENLIVSCECKKLTNPSYYPTILLYSKGKLVYHSIGFSALTLNEISKIVCKD